MSAPLPKPEPTWPEPDSEAIDAIVRSGLGIYDLWEQSPTRHEEAASHAEEIIDVLFPGNPLLCCAKSNEEFATRRREIWRGKLSQLPLIVPNPMLSVKGPTEGGWLSEHSKAATARRVYLCIEFDFSEKARDGVTDTILAPLVRAWRKDGMFADRFAQESHRTRLCRPSLFIVTRMRVDENDGNLVLGVGRESEGACERWLERALSLRMRRTSSMA